MTKLSQLFLRQYDEQFQNASKLFAKLRGHPTNNIATWWLNTEIDEEVETDFRQFLLENLNNRVRILINSPGGLVDSGLKMIACGRSHGRVECHVHGSCNSAAFVFFTCATSKTCWRYCTQDATFVHHNSSCATPDDETEEQRKKRNSAMKIIDGALHEKLMKHLNLDPGIVKSLCDFGESGVFFTADEIVKLGIARHRELNAAERQELARIKAGRLLSNHSKLLEIKEHLGGAYAGLLDGRTVDASIRLNNACEKFEAGEIDQKQFDRTIEAY